MLRRGHEFGTKQPGWSLPSAEWVREAEQLVAFEAKLPAFLKGELQPRDTAERLGLIGVCLVKKHYAAAARFCKELPKDSPQLGGLLAQIGMGLLEQKKWAQAEPLLRESLTIREKTQPDAWNTFNGKAMLGGALLGQKKYAAAEPLLLAGYQGMKKREKTIPPPGRPRLVEAVERLVQLYEALGKKGEAARWKKERETLQKPANKEG
jgi:hypothetical protein